jgi:hypothetical protein
MMNDKNIRFIMRYIIVPVPIIIFFIYHALTNKGFGVYVVGFFCLVIIVVYILFFSLFKIPSFDIFLPPKKAILNGIEGTAKLISVTYLNELINKYPLYELKLLVSVPGKEPYEATRKQLGTPIIIIKLKAGAEFSVIADSADPNNLEIKELENYYKL